LPLLVKVDWINYRGCFFLYASLTLIILIYLFFYMRETKGLSRNEIDKIFDKLDPEYKPIVNIYLMHNIILYNFI
jgi:hypothetical protein